MPQSKSKLKSKVSLKKPFSSQLLVRILVILLVILALTAGYFHASWKTEQRKVEHLEKELEQQQQQSINTN